MFEVLADASTDPTGQTSEFIGRITNWFGDYTVPAALGLLAISVGLNLLLEWGKKAAKAS
jgi:hypothetical protein